MSVSVTSSEGVIQFENANALRSYPFLENAQPVSTDGRTLPEDIIVDLHMVVPSAASTSQEGMVSDGVYVELSSVRVSPEMVSACVRVMDGARVSAALSVMVNRDNFKPYVPVRMEKLVGTIDTGGIITFGDFEFPGNPETYFFSGLKIHPGCVTSFHPPKLRSFFDARSGSRVRGDVQMEFSGYIKSEKNGNSIKLSLEDGAAEVLMSSCMKDLPINGCGAEPIMAINGVEPDEEGRIVLWFH